MRVRETALPGVLLVEPRVHGDARGAFFEAYHAERYGAAGVVGPFVQDNVSRSTRGVLRGLHFQEPDAQGKLVHVLDGAVWDVAVDVRVGSPTFGAWVGEELSASNHRQLWIPPGFAHGFVALSERALFVYKCTAPYRPEHERCVRWDDPELAIDWPIRDVLVSPKDAAGLRLAEIPRGDLPAFGQV